MSLNPRTSASRNVVGLEGSGAVISSFVVGAALVDSPHPRGEAVKALALVANARMIVDVNFIMILFCWMSRCSLAVGDFLDTREESLAFQGLD